MFVILNSLDCVEDCVGKRLKPADNSGFYLKLREKCI